MVTREHTRDCGCRLVSVVAAFLLFTSMSMSAQEVSDLQPDSAAEAVTLQDIVVTANRRETRVADTPVLVTVIKPTQIEMAPGTSVDDVLRKLPAARTMRTHVAECGPGREVTLRGIPDQKRTLVLVDGMPLNDGFSGAVNWSVISKSAVDRIEIVPGPMSALYGSGAMGGVINIITKSPKEPRRTAARVTGGSHNTYSAQIEQSGMGEQQGYYLSVGAYTTEGYMKVKQPEAYHEKNDRFDWNIFGKYYFFPSDDSQLALSFYSVDESYSRGRIFNHQDNAMRGGSLAFNGETAGGIAYDAAFFLNYNQRDVEVSIPPTFDFLDHTETDEMVRLGPRARVAMPLSDQNVLTLGVDSSYDSFEKYNTYQRSDRTGESGGKQIQGGIYVQDETRFDGDRHEWVFTVGVRGDYYDCSDGYMRDTDLGRDDSYGGDSGSAFSPNAGIVYHYQDRTTVRAAAGMAFAAPTLSERYTLFERGPVKLNGNPELDPERSVSFNLGADQRLLPNLMLRVDGYYTEGRDFISSRLVAPPFTYENDNITKVEIMGVEVALEYSPVDPVTVYVGYTYNDSTVEEDDAVAANAGNDLAFQPRHKGRVGLTIDHPKYFTTDLSAAYVGERYVDVENTEADKLDDYVSLDLSLSKRVTPRATVSLNFENLLDERYELYSLPLDESYAPGLLITAGLEVSL